MFQGELGIGYPLHILNRWPLPQILDLSALAIRLFKGYNPRQFWANDILEYRHVSVASAAIATRLLVKVG